MRRSRALFRSEERAAPVAQHVGIFGPLLGGTGARAISQGEVLAELLRAHGIRVTVASRIPNRVFRAGHTAITGVMSAGSLDVAIVEVYSGRAFAMAELTLLVLSPFRVPTVLVLHGGNLAEFATRYPHRFARLLSHATRVVSPSLYLARELDRLAPIDVLPNALPLPAYPARTRARADPRMLWMRAFHRIYRPELALDVLVRLRERVPDATLTMAGSDRGLLGPMKRRAEELGIADAVTFPGFLGPEAKAAALARHDIFLSTNAIDNAPVALLEAAASGLIVLAMRVGGVPDLVTDHENGLLVPDGDTAAMAEAVHSVIRDERLTTSLSLAAQDLGRTASQSDVRRAWVRLLDTVAPSRVKPIPQASSRPSGEAEPTLRLARVTDLQEIASVHRRAFPGSALSALGKGAITRYYMWLLLGPHDAYNVVAEDSDGRLAGFVFAGVFRGALSGYVRQNARYLAVQLVVKPRLWRTPEVRDRAKAAVRMLRGRPGNDPAHHIATSLGSRRLGVLAIAVDPELQGRGFASSLMRSVAGEAAKRGASHMNLTVHPSNEGAIAFYERLGWRRDPEHPGSMFVEVSALS